MTTAASDSWTMELAGPADAPVVRALLGLRIAPGLAGVRAWLGYGGGAAPDDVPAAAGLLQHDDRTPPRVGRCWVGVRPDLRRRGFGRRMLEFLTAQADAMGLEELSAWRPIDDDDRPAAALAAAGGFAQQQRMETFAGPLALSVRFCSQMVAWMQERKLVPDGLTTVLNEQAPLGPIAALMGEAFGPLAYQAIAHHQRRGFEDGQLVMALLHHGELAAASYGHLENRCYHANYLVVEPRYRASAGAGTAWAHLVLKERQASYLAEHDLADSGCFSADARAKDTIKYARKIGASCIGAKITWMRKRAAVAADFAAPASDSLRAAADVCFCSPNRLAPAQDAHAGTGVGLSPRVLVVAWAGADYSRTSALAGQGQLPALSHLMRRGPGLLRLDSHLPHCAPALWTSAYTGKEAGAHQILGAHEPDPLAGGVRPIGPRSRKTKALWNILTQQDRRSLLIGVPGTHPAEPIAGLVVSPEYPGRCTSDSQWGALGPQTIHADEPATRVALENLRVSPGDLTRDMFEAFIPALSTVDEARDRRPAELGVRLAQTASLQAAAVWALEHQAWDLAIVHYPLIEHLAGAFLGAAEPYAQVIPAAYRFCDLMLGRLLALAGEPTTVFVVSGSAMRGQAPHLRPQPGGFVVLGGPGAQSAQGAALYGPHLLDLAPTVLSLLGLHVGRDMAGRVWIEGWQPPLTVQRLSSWEDVAGPAGTLPPQDVRGDVARTQRRLVQLAAAGVHDPLAGSQARALDAMRLEQATNLALIRQQQGRLDQAIGLWSELDRRAPDHLWFGLEEIRCLHLAGRAAEAADKARAMLRRCGQSQAEDDPSPLREFSSRHRRALHHVDPLLSPEALVHLLRATVARADQTRLDGVLAHLRGAEAAGVSHPDLLALIGQGYFAAGQHEAAATVLQRVVEAAPDVADHHAALAHVRLARRRFDDAVESALAATRLRPHFPAAHFVLAQALAELGLLPQAADALRRCIHQAPQWEQPQRMLARLESLGRRRSTPRRAPRSRTQP